MSNDTMLELQLGDVISIKNPVNDNLNDQTFFIMYIDTTKMVLLNINEVLIICDFRW